MTPAIVQLEDSGIEHEIVSYEHDPSSGSYGREAANALGLEAHLVFKTLLASLAASSGQKSIVVAVVPVSHQLDLKKLARAAGSKKAALADSAEAERLTGYVVGGISPLGQRKQLTTYIDSTATGLAKMHVSAGRRGLEVALAPKDLQGILNAHFAELI